MINRVKIQLQKLHCDVAAYCKFGNRLMKFNVNSPFTFVNFPHIGLLLTGTFFLVYTDSKVGGYRYCTSV